MTQRAPNATKVNFQCTQFPIELVDRISIEEILTKRSRTDIVIEAINFWFENRKKQTNAKLIKQ